MSLRTHTHQHMAADGGKGEGKSWTDADLSVLSSAPLKEDSGVTYQEHHNSIAVLSHMVGKL